MVLFVAFSKVLFAGLLMQIVLVKGTRNLPKVKMPDTGAQVVLSLDLHHETALL